MRDKIVCVVPTIRPEQIEKFREAWAQLFAKHKVTLITVWDGDKPMVEVVAPNLSGYMQLVERCDGYQKNLLGNVICRHTDAVRNLGFLYAAEKFSDTLGYALTLDDDVEPPAGSDPIQEHLDVLQRRVPISWMNTAIENAVQRCPDGMLTGMMAPQGPCYLRGFPYTIREEAPVMVSHGVWVKVPDFDGRTQLELTSNGTRPQDLPYSLPYFRGPVPRGVYFPFSGMNVMVRREALPYLYFAPMGPDSGYPDLHRFADIYCGVELVDTCDGNGWAIYTGASTVLHTRMSDPHKNVEQEKLGIEWNELHSRSWGDTDFQEYAVSWIDKAGQFRGLVEGFLGAKS